MDNEKMIESIRILCKNHDITPTKLEEELGFSQGLISRWKDKTPSIDKIVDIADYFHVSLDEVAGYNQQQQINDSFLNILLEHTQNRNIKWHSYSVCKTDDLFIFGLVGDGGWCQYDSDTYCDSTFYTQYKDGFIQIYTVYQIGNIMNPIEICLSIQPGAKSKPISQDYSYDELKNIYLKILMVLDDEAPDEIKAEELKISFINDFKNQVHSNERFVIDVVKGKT